MCCAAGGGIATVAQRIRDRDRALQLEATRLELPQLQSTARTAQDALAADRRANAAARADLLGALRSRHGAELELLAVLERAAGTEEEAGRLRAEVAEVQRATAGRWARWAAAEERARHLDRLAARTGLAAEEASAMQRECGRL